MPKNPLSGTAEPGEIRGACRDGACRGAGVCGAELGAAGEGEVRWFVPERGFLGTDYTEFHGFTLFFILSDNITFFYISMKSV